MLDVPHGTTVSVNGRQVDGLIALRPGDSVAFDGVEAQALVDGSAGRRAPSRGHSGPPAGIGERRSGRDRGAPRAAALRVARRVGRSLRPHVSRARQHHGRPRRRMQHAPRRTRPVARACAPAAHRRGRAARRPRLDQRQLPQRQARAARRSAHRRRDRLRHAALPADRAGHGRAARTTKHAARHRDAEPACGC